MNSNFWQLMLILACLTLTTSNFCPPGEFQTPSGSCQPCSSNCAVCSKADLCTTCAGSYLLVVSDFSSACKTCGQVIPNCKTCLDNMACTACQDGFYMSQGACKHCSTKNLFCGLCNEKGDTCIACLPPYALKNGICYSPDPTTNTATNIVPSSTTDVSKQDSTPVSDAPKVVEILDSNGCKSK